MKQTYRRRDFLKTLGWSAASLPLASFIQTCKKESQEEQRLPNIVLIFIDDMGYADLGCYGATGYATPNIDGLASEGMRFTSFYVAQAVCSASRAALLTGCYPNRVGIFGAYNDQAKVGINPDEEIIAEVLKKKGYATACFGKWHLGHHHKFLPLQNGFDEYLGLPYSNDMWPVEYDGTALPEGHPKLRYPPLPLIEGNEKIAEIRTLEDQDTLTTRYTERAVHFIEKNKDRPFFLYVPHTMVHTPLGVSDKFKGKSQQGKFGDTMMEVDWSVGEILKTLAKHRLEKDTIVIFTSDNGPWLNFGKHAGSAGPFREGKGTAFEGGVRVSCIMRWPKHIPSNSVCDKMAATIDVLPTLAAITGAPLPEHKIDGVNILPLLEGYPDADPRDHLYYYYGRQLRAVRQDKWKLHFPHGCRSYKGVEPGKGGLPGPYAHGETGLELYDLENDRGETRDVADEHPDVVERLKTLGDKARKELGDSEQTGEEVRPVGRIINSKAD
jgi:arylsulfatase A-like enzyme